MNASRTYWYSFHLADDPLPIGNENLRITDASSEEGFRMFVGTHLKAYGEESGEEVLDMYRREVEEGVIDRDKMLVALQGGNPVACVSYEVLEKPDGLKYVLMHNLGVDRTFQGKGLAQDVMRMILNGFLDDFGPGTLVLGDVRAEDDAPISVLQAVGFRRVDPEPWFPFPSTELR